MIYLASPYTHDDPEVVSDRVQRVTEWTAKAWQRGYTVFSPVLHGQALVNTGILLPPTHTFWLGHDFAILSRASTLWVLMLPGWDRSSGIVKEVEFWLTANPGADVEYWPENVIPHYRPHVEKVI